MSLRGPTSRAQLFAPSDKPLLACPISMLCVRFHTRCENHAVCIFAQRHTPESRRLNLGYLRERTGQGICHEVVHACILHRHASIVKVSVERSDSTSGIEHTDRSGTNTDAMRNDVRRTHSVIERGDGSCWCFDLAVRRVTSRDWMA